MTAAPDQDLIKELRAAADRLIAGTPLRSSGKLTILDLATEAGIKRWVLTHKHPELRQQYQAEFKNLGQLSAPVQVAQDQIAELQEDLARIRAEKRTLTALVDTYAIIINQLTDDLAEAEQQHNEALTQLDRQRPEVVVLKDHKPTGKSRASPDLG